MLMTVRAEKANILTRQLQYLQTFLLQLQLFLWSGNKRKTEIASGFAGNFIDVKCYVERGDFPIHPISQPVLAVECEGPKLGA
ncbi:hypothetical protein M3J09_009648 [Ascochyta lentis]